jgi:hypothetical protein
VGCIHAPLSGYSLLDGPTTQPAIALAPRLRGPLASRDITESRYRRAAVAAGAILLWVLGKSKMISAPSNATAAKV